MDFETNANLDFTTHFDYLFKKRIFFCFEWLYRLQDVQTTGELIKPHFSRIQQKLQYGVVLYGSAIKNSEQKLRNKLNSNSETFLKETKISVGNLF